MPQNSDEIAVPIALTVWQDPQCNPLMILSERDCEVFIGCWDEQAVPADYIFKITFKHAWATRHFSFESLPYQVEEFETSSILEVENSNWLNESSRLRLKNYPNWKSWDTTSYHHFIVTGHDMFVEVLAEKYTEERILLQDVERYLPSKYHNHFNR